MRHHPSCGSLDLSPRNKGVTGQNRKKNGSPAGKKRSRASDAPGADGSNGRSIAERGLKQSLRRGDPAAGFCSLQPKQSAFQKRRISRTTGRIRRLRRSKGGSIASGGVRCARHRHMSLFCNPRAAQKGEFANLTARLPNSRSASRRARTREKCRARIRTED